MRLEPEAKVGPLSVTSGEQVLASLGYAQASVSKAVIAQFAIVLANYVFTYASIKLQKPSFEAIEPPNDEQNSTGEVSKGVKGTTSNSSRARAQVPVVRGF
jgi:hypothetical protein